MDQDRLDAEAVRGVLRDQGTGVGLVGLLAEALRAEHIRHKGTAKLVPGICHTCALLVAYDLIEAKRDRDDGGGGPDDP